MSAVTLPDFWSIVAEEYARKSGASDPTNSYDPCGQCVALGGWGAANVDEHGRRCWPTPGHRHGRPEQHFDWRAHREWIARAGRGWGKTFSGASDRLKWAQRYPASLWYVVAPTFADGRDYCFEGDSGLFPLAERKGLLSDPSRQYNRSTLELRLDNGSRFLFRPGTEPERLRGPNAHGAWVDEAGSMPKAAAVARQLDMLVRARFPDGFPTTVLWTTTPSRTPFMRELLARADRAEIGLRDGSTCDNAANLDEGFVENLRKYEGTEWGRQEIYGLLLSAVEGALWDDAALEAMRVERPPDALDYAVVCVDPAASKSESRDECGIVTVVRGMDRRGYVVADDTRRGLPHEWAETVLDACARWSDLSVVRQRPVIVLETNYAKEWMMLSLREAMRKRGEQWVIKDVHATEGKFTRAEPVAAICRGVDPLLRLVGVHPKLEDELVSWVPGNESPNRLDAFVWGGRFLFADLTSQRASPSRPSPRATASIRNRPL